MKLNYKFLLINVSLLIAGILIGWLFFSSSNEMKHEHLAKENVAEWWTCSMHPQIKQTDKGDCPICGMDLIPMSNSSDNDNEAQIEMSEAAMKLANIQTSIVEYSEAEKEIFLQGKVKIDERRVSTQAIHFSGRIEKLYVAFEGEQVTKGQRLATIYSPQLVTAQKELFEAIKSKESYPQLLDAARNKLRLWKLTDKQIADFEKNGKIKENFDITADVSGYVLSKKITTGDYVKAGGVLFEIVDLNRLWVVFDAYEKDLPFIKKNDVIDFTVSSMSSKTFTGKVAYIDPVLNPQKRSTAIRTEVSNIENLLKPEMFVNGKLIASLTHRHNALVVPKSAIMWTGKRSIVYVKVPETDVPVFEMREVELGEALGAFYIISKGLNENEEIVTNGTFTVDAAAQLNNKYSMMNPPIDKLKIDVSDFKGQVSKKIISQLEKALNSYLIMKESLIAADATSVKNEAGALLENINAINTKLLKGEAYNFGKEKIEIIKKNTDSMSKANNIDTQRKKFKPLSEAMIQLVQSFGLQNNKVYIQFCPMADNDKGGYWLSSENEVLNPYFGDMMLRCGEVKDSIQ